MANHTKTCEYEVELDKPDKQVKSTATRKGKAAARNTHTTTTHTTPSGALPTRASTLAGDT